MVHHYLEEETRPASPDSVMQPTFNAIIDPHPNTVELQQPSLERSPSPTPPPDVPPSPPPKDNYKTQLFTVQESPPPPPPIQPTAVPKSTCCPFEAPQPVKPQAGIALHVTSADMLTSLAGAFALGILTASIVAYTISKRAVEE